MAEELRCSECGRPCTEEPCGFMHAVMRAQLAILRQFVETILGGGRRG